MAVHTSIAEFTEYRVLVVIPGSQGILTVRGELDARSLPRVSIPARTRVTPHLRQTIERVWGIRGLVLDYLTTNGDASPCAVVEPYAEGPPNTFRIAEIDSVAEEELSSSERMFVHSLFRGEIAYPPSQVGWVREAVGWVENQVGEEARAINEIEQLNAGGGFALLRLPMKSGRVYWLKATGEPNSHERSVSTFLSQLCPEHIPAVLGTRSDWNAWIISNQKSILRDSPSDSSQRFQLLERAVTAMAKIQRLTAGQADSLLAAGAFDQRLSTMRADSDLLFTHIHEAMNLQTSSQVAGLGESELHELQYIFETTCDLVEELAIPPTLLHGDINAGNILFGDFDCRFIDWSEAYVGHPLAALQHLLLLAQPKSARVKSIWDSKLTEIYRTALGDVCRPDVMERALACMPLVAVASALYGRGTWLRSASPVPLQRQTHVRTLARHMDQTARAAPLLDAIRTRAAQIAG